MDVTLWTIRAATVFYVFAVARLLQGRTMQACMPWTIGCALYLAHVAAAFGLHHHWSHDAAYRETARQTAELFGWNWGGGLYFNYAFTLAWTGDVAWWWLSPGTRAARPRRVDVVLHSYMAFLFLNGVVVFGSVPARWGGIVGMVVMLVVFLRQRWRMARGIRSDYNP